jgi:MOSC domain-containing protein YiiM
VTGSTQPSVVSVARSCEHRFSKPLVPQINLLAALGVEGDAHCGVTVKHRSRVAVDPSQPNLRQVHLLQSELLAEVADKGFSVAPGALGENILTSGIDLLALPRDTLLNIGTATLKITGLRNPCQQIDQFQPGLLKLVVDRKADGGLIRRAGIMAIVLHGGTVKPDDAIEVILPPEPWQALDRV